MLLLRTEARCRSGRCLRPTRRAAPGICPWARRCSTSGSPPRIWAGARRCDCCRIRPNRSCRPPSGWSARPIRRTGAGRCGTCTAPSDGGTPAGCRSRAARCPVPGPVMAQMAAAAHTEGTWLHVPDLPGTRQLLRLTAVADARNRVSPARTGETRAWLTAPDAATPYGIPVTALDPPDRAGPDGCRCGTPQGHRPRRGCPPGASNATPRWPCRGPLTTGGRTGCGRARSSNTCCSQRRRSKGLNGGAGRGKGPGVPRPARTVLPDRGPALRHLLSSSAVPWSAARPASRRATGTRNGEQET
ncbi:hypothetical protein QF026_008391 [Streptomyces aurantiacus]|nr:hypothetical protein [Streptomyces aurantiacus]